MLTPLNMARDFPIFNSHLDLAHRLWKELLEPGDLAIDATCGNGHDTLFLAQMGARVIACDIQQEAIERTKKRVEGYDVELIHSCHSKLLYNEIKLVVYNLGYLPNGNKALTTTATTTLASVKNFLPRVTGAISLTCYAHPEGKKEKEALLTFCQTLPPDQWNCTHFQWKNRTDSPSLIFIQKCTSK